MSLPLDSRRQYIIAREFFEFSIAGDEVFASLHGGNMLWLVGAADNFCELGILEALLLDGMEGLA